MKQSFDAEAVMTSLRHMAELLEEVTETNAILALELLHTISALQTGRPADFSHQQLGELTQIESAVLQKLQRIIRLGPPME